MRGKTMKIAKIEVSSDISASQSRARMSDRLPQEVDALRGAGVVLVAVEYAGAYGDRRIGDVTYYDAGGHPLTPHIPRGVRQEVEVFFHELLELRFSGWETGEGARGAFEWLIEIDRLEHRHDARFVAYDTARMVDL
jgi:hypothetical protein